jgi:hypothetical protein
VKSRVESGLFRTIDPRAVVFAFQGMLNNLAIYEYALGHMDFISTADLAAPGAKLFLMGLTKRRSS